MHHEGHFRPKSIRIRFRNKANNGRFLRKRPALLIQAGTKRLAGKIRLVGNIAGENSRQTLKIRNCKRQADPNPDRSPSKQNNEKQTENGRESGWKTDLGGSGAEAPGEPGSGRGGGGGARRRRPNDVISWNVGRARQRGDGVRRELERERFLQFVPGTRH